VRNAIRRTLLIVTFLCIGTGGFAAQSGDLRVATRQVKPFVFEENGKLTGFSVELWNEIAKQLGVKSQYDIKPTVKELLSTVKAQTSDLAISAISITAERELELDFSQPMFDAGLQILTPVQTSRAALFQAIFTSLFSAAIVPYVIGVVVILIAIAHLVWALERLHPTGMLTHREYFPGIFETCWWAAATLATQADQMPRAALARVVAVFWMFASVIFIAYFTAAVTSNLTLQQLRGDINGPEDLPGKRVASIMGSTAEVYLRQHNIENVGFSNAEESFKALQSGQVDAVVYDAPVLLYYASHDGKGKVQTVGSIFRKENYGIVFPDKSPLRKRVNEALLKLKENGSYDQLYSKWFGGSGS
jgi:polar amino acid transport system substrate-binding protein